MLEHLETADIRKLQIQENDRGRRVCDPIREISAGVQVIGRLFTVGGEAHGKIRSSFAQGALHEERIMFVVFDQENHLTRGVSNRWFGEKTLGRHADTHKIDQDGDCLDGVKTCSGRATLDSQPTESSRPRVLRLDLVGCGLKLCNHLR